MTDELQDHIEAKIAELDSRIELIALDRAGSERLRLFIDHPEGVDLALCERVSNQLRELTADWALEVSSPGLDRPLTKPTHYRRFVGFRVRVRTRSELEGRKSFTGRLAAADEQRVMVEDGEGTHEIPLSVVHRSNLVPEFSEVGK
jgi:ribosome maturation factor RimP